MHSEGVCHGDSLRGARALLPLLLAFALVRPAPAGADSLDVRPPESVPGATPSLLGPPGTWHPLQPSVGGQTARHGHSAILDGAANRVVLFGGINTAGIRFADVFQIDVCSLPGTRPLAASGTPPSARFGHTAILDPSRGRMIVFGGNDGATRNDASVLSLGPSPAWSALSPAGSPPAGRYGHTAIYDPVRDRMIVFGGYDGANFRNDLWELRLSGTPTWAPLAATGTPPALRDYHSAIYDPVRDRMIVFGGNNGLNFNDVWALDLSGSPAWSLVSPAGAPPGPRLAHAAVYDPVEDRMLVTGGVTGSGTLRDDTWQLRFSGAPAWSLLVGGGGHAPGVHSAAVVLLPGADRLLLHGGTGSIGSSDRIHELVIPGVSHWKVRPPNNPDLRQGHVAVFDPPRRRFLLHGGEAIDIFGDLFEMPADGPGFWRRSCVSGPEPSARFGHNAIYDPTGDRVILYGGYDGGYLGDLWSLAPNPPMTWAPLAAAGTPPGPRDFASLVQDPARNRLILFGGNRGGTFLNDLWALDLTGTPAWSPLSPAGTPPSARLAHRAVFDLARDRMLVFGGYDTAELGDLWALEFSPTLRWVRLLPAGTPPSARYSTSLVIDSARDRLVLFGGRGALSTQDTWELPLSVPLAWAPLAVPPSLPAPRHGHTAVYDPLHDLMLVTGGYRYDFSGSSGYLGDSWVLNWGSAPTPTLVSLVRVAAESDVVRLVWWGASPAGARATLVKRNAGGTWTPIGEAGADGTGRWSFEDRAVSPGARYDYAIDLGDGPQAITEVRIPDGPRLSFSGFWPNPAGDRSLLAFALPGRSRVALQVFDVAGRRVSRLDLGTLPGGGHRIADDRMNGLPAGTYVLQLETDFGTLRQNFTRLR